MEKYNLTIEDFNEMDEIATKWLDGEYFEDCEEKEFEICRDDVCIVFNAVITDIKSKHYPQTYFEPESGYINIKYKIDDVKVYAEDGEIELDIIDTKVQQKLEETLIYEYDY